MWPTMHGQGALRTPARERAGTGGYRDTATERGSASEERQEGKTWDYFKSGSQVVSTLEAETVNSAIKLNIQLYFMMVQNGSS